jgi:hypothetical protein
MIQITMTAARTSTQLGISAPAIDVFRLNHSMIASRFLRILTHLRRQVSAFGGNLVRLSLLMLLRI